jgi:predicted dienelactone hydrolase
MGIVYLALIVSAFPSPNAQAPDPGQRGLYATGAFSITTTNPETGSTIDAVIYYPASGDAIDPAGAPYAAIVFAHGFMASPSSYPGNADHLASWGYIVALPDLPENDTEVRQSDARHMFSYLERANSDVASPLYGMINPARLGVTGHSLGGLTAMILAARDPRVRAAVALDPTNAHSIIGAEPWDYAAEAPNTTAPLLVLGAPSQLCNAEAGYNAMYDSVGSVHRTKLVIAGASHCDFMDTDSQLHIFGCNLFCGGSYATARVTLVERYTTAWFNYYLRGQTEYYDYLYGGAAQEDVSAGRISERSVRSAPRNVSAAPEGAAIRIRWTPADYAVIAGYNVYRATQSGQSPASPYAQIGHEGSYLDTAVTAGQRYYYTVRSRDAAGHAHAASEEVSAVASGVEPPATDVPQATATTAPQATPTSTTTSQATVTTTPQATPTSTTTPQATPPSTPDGPTETPLLTMTPTSQPTVALTITPPTEQGSRTYLPLLSR